MIDKSRDMFMGYSYPYPYVDNNIENRLNILERNIRRLEERINKLEGNSTVYNTESYMSTSGYTNPYQNNMYNMI